MASNIELSSQDFDSKEDIEAPSVEELVEEGSIVADVESVHVSMSAPEENVAKQARPERPLTLSTSSMGTSMFDITKLKSSNTGSFEQVNGYSWDFAMILPCVKPKDAERSARFINRLRRAVSFFSRKMHVILNGF